MISTYIFTFIFIHFKRKTGIYQLKKAFSISKIPSKLLTIWLRLLILSVLL